MNPPVKNKRTDERGVAVVLTIGILGMVLMLMMAFTASALHSHTMATLNRDTVLSRLAAEMGVQRAYAIIATELSDFNNLRNLFPNSKPGADAHAGPTTASSAWDGRTYWFSDGTDTLGIREAFAHTVAGEDMTPDASNPILDSDAGWFHVLDPDTSTEIVARFAFIVIDESGKLDPNYAISQTVGEGNETLTRQGNSPSDVNLMATIPSALATDLQYTSQSGGELATTLQWLSHYHMILGTTAGAANSDEIFSHLFPHSEDINAYNNTVEDLHRFDLANADWDSFGNDVAASNLTSAASTFWSGSAPASNTGGIGWLANAADPFLQNQVAANLIDFSDTDSIPTTDSQTAPTYLGLEQVPFLNEFMFQMMVYDAGTDYRFLVRTWTELVNLFDTPVGNGATLTVELEVTSPDLPTSPTTFTLNWSALTTDVAAQSYHALGSVSQSAETTIGTATTLSDATIRVVEATLHDSSGNLLDYATTEPSPQVDVQVLLPVFRSVETNDPRANHTEDDWTWHPNGWLFGFSNTTTLLATNDVCDPNPGGPYDEEAGAIDPWEVSTAYIPNRAIETLWELGAVHRGEEWRTIRLSEYSESLTTNLGLGGYALGDANILCQVKTSGRNFAYGTVNVNSDNPDALAALLVGLSVGAEYGSSTTGTSTITATQAASAIGSSPSSATAGQWLFENGAAGVTTPMHDRGGIARIDQLSNGAIFTQDTDRAKEEIIGKIAGLGTVRANYFTVIVTAQSVRDLAINGGSLGTFDAGIDVIRAETRVMAYVYRDALTNAFRLLHYEYIE